MTRQLRAGDRLVLASHNAGKVREFAALLGSSGVVLTAASTLGLPEPEETEPDFAGNARLKAAAAAQASGIPSLADDSGFCVAALGGAPGVLSARWAGGDFPGAMARIHAQADAGSRAWFVCALCLAWPDPAGSGVRTATFVGRVDGHTCWPPRGGLGFGYDPMFVPAGSRQSYGEMPPDTKHASSHRARAFAAWAAACLEPAAAPPR